MTFDKAEPDSGEKVKTVSGPPETGRVGWMRTRARPVLLRLVMPAGRDSGGVIGAGGVSLAGGVEV